MSSISRARLMSMFVAVVIAALMFGVTASPALAKGTKKHKKHENKNVTAIRIVAAQYKLSKKDTKALITLAYRESSWNPRCITGSYRGLFQIRTKSKGWCNPYWNTARAIRDIKKVYRTPTRALAHSYSHGWY